MKKRLAVSFLIPIILLLLWSDGFSQGRMWGVASSGGSSGVGVLFKTEANGSGFEVKYEFQTSYPGSRPTDLLAEGPGGVLYGVTAGGGSHDAGTLFSFDPSTQSYTHLYNFVPANGKQPMWGLTFIGSKAYGVTNQGGTTNEGTLFVFDVATNTYTKLFNFSGINGSVPVGGLILGSNGKLYGMTSGGGIAWGVIFEYDPATTTFTKKFDFQLSSNGTNPFGSLTEYAPGEFYGVTYTGGTNQYGVLFKYDLNTNTYTKKLDFDGSKGQYPTTTMLRGSNGKLYGTTLSGGANGLGVLFEYDPTTEAFVKKHDFTSNPGNTVVEVSAGKLWGITGNAIFEYDINSSLYATKRVFPQGEALNRGSLCFSNNMLFGTGGGGSTSSGFLFEIDPLTNSFAKHFDFQESSTGITPTSKLSQHTNGKFYGVTRWGGDSGRGTIFEFDPVSELYTKKIDFDGVNIRQSLGLALFPNGKFYGVAAGGISGGRIFEFDPTGNTLTLKSTLNGEPRDALLLADDGFLYGNLNGGDYGLLYKYDPSTDTVEEIFYFDGANGKHGESSLICSDGNLYGVTTGGGAYDEGTLFQYNLATSTYSKRIDFHPSTAASPTGKVVLASNGKFYGLTSAGGTYDAGVLYEFDPLTNSLSVKANIRQETGYEHSGGLIEGSNGKLYGLWETGGLQDAGVFFEFDPATGVYAKKTDFTGANGRNPVNGTMMVERTDQTIVFDPIPSKTFGDAPFTISATASSGLPVTFSSSDPSIATISDNVVTITGGGTVVISAYQVGDAQYNFAFANQTLVVEKASQTIAFDLGENATKYFGDPDFQISASGGASGNPVTFEVSDPTVAEINGDIVTMLKAGVVIITATQSGDNRYNDAPPVQQTLTILKRDQVITFDPIGPKTYGDPMFVLSASSSSGLPVRFVVDNTDIAVIEWNELIIARAGTTAVYAIQDGNEYYNAAQVEQTLVVNKADQAITFNPLSPTVYGGSEIVLNATSSSGLEITYTSSDPSIANIVSNVVYIQAVGSVTITASQAGHPDYYNPAADQTQTLVIDKASQPIAFTLGANSVKTYGDVPFILSATGGASGNEVVFSSSNSTVITIDGNQATIIGAGTAVITASQAGNANYHAGEVSETLTVDKALQGITFSLGAHATKTYGDADFTLAATGGASGVPILFTSSDPNVVSVTDNAVTITGVGTATISANQAGNDNYEAAPEVSRAITVNKGNQQISFSLGTSATKYLGDPDFILSATGGGSGNAVTFISTDPSVATVNGNTVSIVGLGTTTIIASQAGSSNYNAAPDVSDVLNIDTRNQVITFDPIFPKTYGDAPFNLTASASSGLAVTYASSNTSIATVNGNTITILAAGSVMITASQMGNETYHPAADISRELLINKAEQIITFDPLPEKVYGDPAFSLAATGGPSGMPVVFTSSDPSIATVSGNVLTIQGAGSATITASQGGAVNYNAANDVSRVMVVAKANQSITFAPLSSKAYGQPPFELSATASSGLTVTFASSDPSVATINGSSVTIVGGGSTTITGMQPGNQNYNSAIPVDHALVVDKASQAITFEPLSAKTYGDAPFMLNASSSSGLTLTYSSSDLSVATISGNTVTIVGAGTAAITASQSGNQNYDAAADASQTLIVNKAGQTITFDAIAAKTYGDPSFNLHAASSSGLPIYYTSSVSSVATVNGNEVTILNAGLTSIVARQDGNANYYAAPDVSRDLAVNKKDQTILFTLGTDANKTYGDPDFILVAAGGSSGNPVTFTSSNPLVAGISGNTINIVGAGTATITASQAGNSNYNAAADVSDVLAVGKSDQTITFDLIPPKSYGNPAFILSASSTSGLPVTFTSSDASVATISGATVTIVGAGNVTITASQEGDADFNPALNVQQVVSVVLPKPTIPSSYIFLVNEYTTQFDFMVIPGDGNGRLVVLKKDGPVDFDPDDNTSYVVGQTFGTNSDNRIGLVLSGQDAIGTIKDLLPGSKYYVEVFEFNTSNNLYSYLTTATATSGQATTQQETVQVITPVNNSVNQNAPTLNVVTSAVSGATTYTVELYTNSLFTGTPIVRSSATTTVAFTGLAYSTQYFARAKTNLSSEYGPSTTFTMQSADRDAYITAPVDGSTNNLVSLTVTSNPVAGATTYYIELCTSPDFGSEVLVKSGAASQTFTLQFSTTYYARVKTNVSPDYGVTKSFTTASALGLSYVTSPASGATNQATSLTVSTNTLTGATSYTIQLSPDNTFQTGVISNTSSSTSMTFLDLYYNTRYYTRVSSSLTPGQWGSARSFTTRDHILTSSAPANNATNVNYYLTLSAATISGTSVYSIEANTSAAFDGISIVRSGSSSQVFTLQYDTKYYVRVTSDRASGWGSTRTFTTGSPVSLAVVTAPANGASANYTTQNVTARSLYGATSYTIELNTASDFTGTPITQTGSSNVLTFTGLTPETTYYTRVKTNLSPDWGTSVTNFVTVANGQRATLDPVEEEFFDVAPFEVRVYGNPFRQKLTVLITSPEQVDATIMLTDLSGKEFHKSLSPSNSFVDIEAEMPNGVYILRVQNGDKFKSVRVIKME